ncbi:hypothetical protein CBOM_01315 [Ceraceosorus bombacis]|uniref:Uncharacterized protein n=1 Tax=Ceraceosorus bombacis TaxID=401625 RepID=A0A0P1BC53_9BASI|nr:hypothetical protein CBOM_01315 [Ceraceosorus bombacis]
MRFIQLTAFVVVAMALVNAYPTALQQRDVAFGKDVLKARIDVPTPILEHPSPGLLARQAQAEHHESGNPNPPPKKQGPHPPPSRRGELAEGKVKPPPKTGTPPPKNDPPPAARRSLTPDVKPLKRERKERLDEHDKNGKPDPPPKKQDPPPPPARRVSLLI